VAYNESMDELNDIISQEIARDGPITFARYMTLALYHPTLGYYAGGGTGREPLGWSGDYFTSSDVSPLWGWAIARQLRQMWELLGRPPRFDVVEAGAGRGLLAREVWRFARLAAPEFGEALCYTVVDQAVQAGQIVQADEAGLAPTGGPDRGAAPSLFEARRERLSAELARLGAPEGAVRWVATLAQAADLTPSPLPYEGRGTDAHVLAEGEQRGLTLSSLPYEEGGTDLTIRGVERKSDAPATKRSQTAPPRVGEGRGGGVIGVVVSNELLDALPVHLVRVVGDTQPALAEVYVTVDASGRLTERLDAPSSPEVAVYLDRFAVPWRTFGDGWRTFGDGWRTEVSLAAEAWMREAAGILQRGFALTIDYGATARRLYTRDRRRGTLAVYAHHQFSDRPLLAPGRQDITAHVNFSALARAGSARGLRVAGYTTQAAFLKALGVRAAAEALGTRLYPEADTARQTDRGQADLLRRRLLEGAVSTLLDPRGLGGFRVLVQTRDVPGVRRALLGLRSYEEARHVEWGSGS